MSHPQPHKTPSKAPPAAVGTSAGATGGTGSAAAPSIAREDTRLIERAEEAKKEHEQSLAQTLARSNGMNDKLCERISFLSAKVISDRHIYTAERAMLVQESDQYKRERDAALLDLAALQQAFDKYKSDHSSGATSATSSTSVTSTPGRQPAPAPVVPSSHDISPLRTVAVPAVLPMGGGVLAAVPGVAVPTVAARNTAAGATSCSTKKTGRGRGRPKKASNTVEDPSSIVGAVDDAKKK